MLGYSKINSTALASTNIRNGFHFNTKYDVSHLLAWTDDGKVYENTTAAPGTGDFSATLWHTDTAGANQGRFSRAPAHSMTYCNGKESLVWSGDEGRIGAFILMDDAAFDGAENPKIYDDIMNDKLSTAGHYVSIGTQKFGLILTHRKAKGFKFYIKTANTSAATMSCKVYTGSWTAVSSPVDGTIGVTGKTLSQTGTFSFTSTVANAIPFHYKGNYAFAYLFEITSGAADIYHITGDYPPQPFCDIWDSIGRLIPQFQVSFNGAYEDYSADIADTDSYAGSPIGADLSGLLSTDHVIAMSEERLSGLNVKMAPGCVNLAASALTISYWTGSAYTSCSAIDWTQNPAGTTLGQGGYITWNPPAEAAEFKQELFGTYGYAYKLTVSGTLTGTHGNSNVVIDTVWGIPAQQSLPTYSFCLPYKYRLLGIAPIELNQGNRIDFTPTGSPDVWNGTESSMYGLQSLFADTSQDLVAGITLFNRFGNNNFMIALLFTHTSTHVLSGDGPEDFKIEEISPSIGCPAINSLCLANIGFNLTQDVTRNVALWVSNAGPMMFDGALMSPVPGIENYFDKTKPECVNWAAADQIWAKINTETLTWHIGIPSGATTTEVNIHLGYDLTNRERGWFEFDHNGTETPRVGIEVKSIDGVGYLYGGIDTGHIVRLDHGSSWMGNSITYRLATGDFWPGKDVWYKSLVRALKIIANRGDVDLSLTTYCYVDTEIYSSSYDFQWLADDDFAWLSDSDFQWLAYSDTRSKYATFSISKRDNQRLIISTKNKTSWEARSFRFEFVCDNSALDSNFALLAYALFWELGREDFQEV